LSLPATAPSARETFEARLRELRQDRRNAALPGLAATAAGIVVLLAVPVHKTLAVPDSLNEALGTLGQAVVGVNFASYRVQHLDHHRAGDPFDDPDGHIYRPIAATRPGLPRIAVWLFGTFVELAVKIVQKGIGSYGTGTKINEASKRQSRRHTVYVVLAQLSLVGLCWALTGRITGYVEQWLLPLFGVAVLVNRTRIFIEHGVALLDGEPYGDRVPTVDMDCPAWERLVLAPWGFAWHASHHLHLTVPQYNLPRLSALLAEQGTPGFRKVRGSYARTLWRGLWAPAFRRDEPCPKP
jgi:fatty acid desaturase